MNLKYQLHSFCGFSLAAVETASKPIKAKNTTPAPQNTTIHNDQKIVATEEVKKDIFPELKSASPLINWYERSMSLHC
jgi:hypothetical protein